jgi:hypothetical protein
MSEDDPITSEEFEGTFTEEILEPIPEGEGVRIEDFYACKPAHRYIFAPTNDLWPASSVDGTLPPVEVQRNGKLVLVAASKWLDQNRAVEQMTWVPGEPELIEGKLVVNGGWKRRKGVHAFNLYHPPRIKLGSSDRAWPWFNHVHTVYSDEDAQHIINWLAHRVQRPGEKPNHALVLGGGMGIGKDSLLVPVRDAVGPWNFQEASPDTLLGSFNGYAKAVILRVNEARDLLGDNRFSFYNHTKALAASPPEILRINEKFTPEYYAFNCIGLIITSNHRTDGIFLPADDRRHYVAWSDRKKEELPEGYFLELWDFFGNGGAGHVAAYLHEVDLSDFDPFAPPPKTAAFWDIVGVNRAPEDDELADVLDAMGNPDAVTVAMLQMAATGETAAWLTDRKNRRALPHRMERCGYSSVRNDGPSHGMWTINGKRVMVYAKQALTAEQQLRAAKKLVSS